MLGVTTVVMTVHNYVRRSSPAPSKKVYVVSSDDDLGSTDATNTKNDENITIKIEPIVAPPVISGVVVNTTLEKNI
jgi:hypothetical protein